MPAGVLCIVVPSSKTSHPSCGPVTGRQQCPYLFSVSLLAAGPSLLSYSTSNCRYLSAFLTTRIMYGLHIQRGRVLPTITSAVYDRISPSPSIVCFYFYIYFFFRSFIYLVFFRYSLCYPCTHSRAGGEYKRRNKAKLIYVIFFFVYTFLIQFI